MQDVCVEVRRRYVSGVEFPRGGGGGGGGGALWYLFIIIIISFFFFGGGGGTYARYQNSNVPLKH